MPPVIAGGFYYLYSMEPDGKYNDFVGDIIWIHLDGLGVRLEMIVTEVDPEERRACRFKATHPDPLWCLLGLIEEDGEYVIVEWSRELRDIDISMICEN